MIKTNLYNSEGKIISELELPEDIFGLKPNKDLMKEAVVAQQANSRMRYAHVKTRGEVSGGGKKPWKQKHTGQARHGSTRSPLWRKGGVTFGPTPDASYSKKINVKKKRLAFFMALSSKLKNNTLFIMDELKMSDSKTKGMVKILKNLKIDKTVLVSSPSADKNVYLSTRNIANAKTILTKSLNIVDLLSYKYLLMPKESVDIIKQTFKK